MQARNEIAKRLIAKADELGIRLECGYFNGQTYCAGVRVEDHVEAFRLGSLIGADFGLVGFDVGRASRDATLAFRDAHVSA